MIRSEIKIFIMLVGVLLCGCNRHEEPPVETVWPIQETYMPVGVVFDKTDTDFLERCREWNNKRFIVNDVDELPADPLGFNDTYRNINYKNYSLILVYRLHRWSIDTYRSWFTRNNVENTFNWTLTVVSNDFDPQDTNKVIITRFAITVKKLPEDANLLIGWQYIDHGFDWSDVPDNN